MFKYLNEFQPLDDWFPYEYIDAEVKKKLDETKGKPALKGDSTLCGIYQSQSQLVKNYYY